MTHIYTESLQPATCWTDDHGPEPVTYHWPDQMGLWCGCCRRVRQAKNCVMQSYYDHMDYWCAPGKGCKDPGAIAAKERREFRNRSVGQKLRWARAA